VGDLRKIPRLVFAEDKVVKKINAEVHDRVFSKLSSPDEVLLLERQLSKFGSEHGTVQLSFLSTETVTRFMSILA
jgi:hypothetical protein